MGISIILAIAISAFLAILARTVYGIPIPISTLPAFVLVVIVAAVAFTCLGFAFTTVVSRSGAAVPLGMGVTLSLYFLSGNFFILEDWPRTIEIISSIFPVKHLNVALLTAINPNNSGSGIAFWHLFVVMLWGVVGLVIASLFFRWTPKSD